MKNKELLKKKITYSSTHRGFKEMDLLLGSFVKMYLNKLNTSDLIDLHNLLICSLTKLPNSKSISLEPLCIAL